MARAVKSGRTARAKAGKRRSPLVGGLIGLGPAAALARINASLDFDRRLYAQDIAASQAHAAMLGQQGIIPAGDVTKIAAGLARIRGEIEAGDFTFDPALEDIHMAVEARLAELIGPAAGRLHTARSRNDQVATDFRLWVRDALDCLDGSLRDLQTALIDKAESHADAVMPGFTHLQPAQPVTLGHLLLAYVEMLGRDRGRIADARRRLNESPLGSGALAGTSFPIDRKRTAKALGFDRPTANSIDGVSDRDFALEFLAAGAIVAVHLSRLGEEIVLWTSPMFGYARLSETFSTGSSIMPQKRNPDGAELVRGKAGRLFGALTGMLTVMKGLPLAYNKDLQEDKEPVFGAADTLDLCLSVMTGMVGDLTFDRARMRQAADEGHLTATDLADWLVRSLGLPFRDAYRVAGRLVGRAEAKGCRLDELTLAEMRMEEKRITADVFSALDVNRAVAGRKSEGGTAPASVRRAVAEARRRFLGKRS